MPFPIHSGYYLTRILEKTYNLYIFLSFYMFQSLSNVQVNPNRHIKWPNLRNFICIYVLA